MNKRAFLKRLFATLAGLPLASRGARAAPRTVLLQESPLAGFQYYDGERLWPRLAAGQAVELRRNPRNPHDDRAVEIWRAGHMLGHLPRVENTAVAQMLDRGEPLTARITTLNQSRGPGSGSGWRCTGIRRHRHRRLPRAHPTSATGAATGCASGRKRRYGLTRRRGLAR